MQHSILYTNHKLFLKNVYIHKKEKKNDRNLLNIDISKIYKVINRFHCKMIIPNPSL